MVESKAHPACASPVPSDFRASWIALIAALLVGLYLCWRIISPFLDVLMWAAVLVTVFQPVHRRLLLRIRHPGWTATLSTLLVIVTILGPVTLITLAVVDELRNIANRLEANPIRLLDFDSPVLGPWLRWLDQYVDLDRLQSPAFLRATLERWTGTLANSTIGVVGGAVSIVVQTLLVVFTMFYLFRDGDAIRRAAFEMLPLERSQTRDVVARTKEVVGATVYGVIVIALIQGSLGAFIFWALGLPSPLLWGVVMFFLCMIPMAGAFLVWAPAALFLAFTGAWTRAIILVVWGVLVVGSIDNVLSPRLVGQRTRLHELLVFFSVLGGLEAFGVLGVVLGPVIVAVTLAIIEMVRHANRPADETLREEGVIEAQADVRQTVTAEAGKDLADERP
jgi:predicted PurR-regulated permease PerM